MGDRPHLCGRVPIVVVVERPTDLRVGRSHRWPDRPLGRLSGT